MTFTDLPPLERRRLAREYRTWSAANRRAAGAYWAEQCNPKLRYWGRRPPTT